MGRIVHAQGTSCNSMKRYLFRFLCIALLLAGQQAAVTHALAHAQNAYARTALAHGGADSEGSSGSERFALCDFDFAYSQVLGAVHSASIQPLTVDASFAAVPVHSASRARSTEVPFLIRGPPPVL